MKKILIDSNVLLDIFEDDQNWAEWSVSMVSRYSINHTLCINAVIYSEVSIGFDKIEDVENVLTQGKIILINIPREALFLAGKVFLQYRRNKGKKTSILPDFFIGAHAAVEDIPLLTRDKKRMDHYFPTVQFVTPP